MSIKVDKPWGCEVIWAHTDKYAGKFLYINAGEKLSLQYHEKKSESIYVLNGRIKMHLYDDAPVPKVFVMVSGDSVDIPAGTKHRMEAIDNATLLEVSTAELEDVVRVEDEYGRTNE